MKIRLLLFASFITITCVCFGQNIVTKDSIQIANEKSGNAKKPAIPSGRTILADMKTNNPVMYSQYQSAKRNQRTGIIMTSVGGGVIMVGAIFSIFPDAANGTVTMGPFFIETDGNNSGLRKTGNVLMIAGTACLSVGLPVMIIGGNKKKQTFQEFKNQYYLSQQPSSYLQMNIYPNRIGIAYNF